MTIILFGIWKKENSLPQMRRLWIYVFGGQIEYVAYQIE